MNYFFFLKNINNNFNSKIDIFNLAPMESFYNNKIKKKYVKVFFLNKSKWEIINYDEVLPYEIKTYDLNELNKKYKEQSFFISLFDKNQDIFQDNNYMNSEPTWRSNISIRSKHSSASYQGEIPSTITKRKISLVSCNPMSQDNDNTNSFFYLVNLLKEPIKLEFTVDIINSKKSKIGSLKCYTNTINFFDISKYTVNNEFLIFKSQDHGGIPIYFNFTNDYKFMSLEHTHPPVEYVYGGNRIKIQKEKKKYWFNQ